MAAARTTDMDLSLDDSKDVKEVKKEVKEVKRDDDSKDEEKKEVKVLDLEGDITLEAGKGEKKSFVVSRKAAQVSKLIMSSLESDADATMVPLPGVDATILTMIVEYMKHHDGADAKMVEKPLRSKVMSEVCEDKWDAKFIDDIGVRRKHLYDLILAANYMDMNILLHLGCAKVASLIKGQPLDKIKEILAVAPEDASPTTAAAGTATTAAAPAKKA